MYRFFERAVAVVALLANMDVFVRLVSPEIMISEKDPRMSSTDLKPGLIMVQALIYLLLIVVIAPRLSRVLGAMGKIRLLTALYALSVASILWSIDPMLTFRRDILLCAWLVVGVYLGERYSMDEFLDLLGWAFGIVITLSVALYFIHPSYVLDPSHAPAWRGLCLHKNSFGACMTLGALVFATCARRTRPFVNYSFCAASMLMIFLSHSATALLLGLVILISTPLWRLAKLPKAQLVPIGIIAAIVIARLAIWISGPPLDFLNALGRDATLTGRTHLWAPVMVAISRRPLLGYGYDVFWQGLKGESLQAAISAGWLAPSSHNGYLELALGLGIPALVLFAFIYISLITSALRYSRRTPGATARWPIAFAIFVAVQNAVESTLLGRNAIDCLLLVVIFTALKLEEYRNARREPTWAMNVVLPEERATLHPELA